MPFVILVLNVELVQPEKTGVQSALVKIVSRVRPKQNHFKASCHSDMCFRVSPGHRNFVGRGRGALCGLHPQVHTDVFTCCQEESESGGPPL